MISQNIINTIEDCLEHDVEIHNSLVRELLENYINLIKDNAKLHKELARLRNERLPS